MYGALTSIDNYSPVRVLTLVNASGDRISYALQPNVLALCHEADTHGQ